MLACECKKEKKKEQNLGPWLPCSVKTTTRREADLAFLAHLAAEVAERPADLGPTDSSSNYSPLAVAPQWARFLFTDTNRAGRDSVFECKGLTTVGLGFSANKR